MKTHTIKTPISKVAYSAEPHPCIPGLWVHRVMSVNGGIASFVIDDSALEFVAEACRERIEELRKREAAE